MRKWWYISIGLLIGGILSGCTTYQSRVSQCRSAVAHGNGELAVKAADALVEDYAQKDSDKDALLVCLEAGQAYRLRALQTEKQHDYQRSQTLFKRAEKIYQAYQQKAKVSLSREGLSLFTTPDTLPYRGQGHEAIMLSVYQALNLLQMGECAAARQQLRQVYHYQRATVAANAERIAQLQDAEKKAKNNADILSTKQRLTSQTDALLRQLPDTTGYETYVNPFAEFLVALYHHHLGQDPADYEHARHSLSRVLSMLPKSEFLQAELKRYESPPTSTPSVYLIHESGLAPQLNEVELLLPLYTGRSLSLFGVAFPTLRVDPTPTPRAALITSTTTVAEPIGDMDAIVAQAYKDDFPLRLTRIIATTLAKTATTVTASEFAYHSRDPIIELLTFIFSTIYQASTNVADTRTWTTLPKRFSVARTEIPANRIVKVSLDGSPQQAIQLPTNGTVWVIYLRSHERGIPPTITKFKLR